MYLPTLEKEMLPPASALMAEEGRSSERAVLTFRNTGLPWHIPEDKRTDIFNPYPANVDNMVSSYQF
jgi:hypothetical protein